MPLDDFCNKNMRSHLPRRKKSLTPIWTDYLSNERPSGLYNFVCNVILAISKSTDFKRYVYNIFSRKILLSLLKKDWLIKHQSCHHIETSQLIWRANEWTGFYMMATSAFNELKKQELKHICNLGFMRLLCYAARLQPM